MDYSGPIAATNVIVNHAKRRFQNEHFHLYNLQGVNGKVKKKDFCARATPPAPISLLTPLRVPYGPGADPETASKLQILHRNNHVVPLQRNKAVIHTNNPSGTAPDAWYFVERAKNLFRRHPPDRNGN